MMFFCYFGLISNRLIAHPLFQLLALAGFILNNSTFCYRAIELSPLGCLPLYLFFIHIYMVRDLIHATPTSLPSN